MGAVVSFFQALPVGFAIWVVGPGAGEAGLDVAAGEGVVTFVVTVVVTPCLIVLSNDSRASSLEKPRSSWENIAAVKSPMESRGSPSFSDSFCAEFIEKMVDTDVLRVEL